MLEIRLLGQFDVRLDGQPVDLPTRPAELLAYLALSPDVPHRRERLAGLLWLDFPDASARTNLRKALWYLRDALGDRWFDTDRAHIALHRNDAMTIDTAVLEGATDPLEAVTAYGGDLLPGFYADWVLLARDRLEAAFEGQMKRLLDELTAEARWPEVVRWAERWVALGRAPEPAYRALMRAHAARGDRTGVAATYERCTAALEEEVGAPPSEATLTLYETLMSGERVPLPQTLAGQFRRRDNLPAAATPLVGREDDLERIGRLLTGPDCRLLALVGPGGIGKTQLALEAARRLREDFRDGVVLVELARIPDAGDVLPAFLTALELPSSGDPRAQLLRFLRGRHLLLVVDNFEHVLEAAPLLAEILGAAPDVRLLVTSRARLSLAAETVYEVDGLRVPPKSDGQPLEAYEAAQMFLIRARRARPDLALDEAGEAAVGRLCRVVDGMPLALELAGAWARALPPAEIAAELERDLGFLEAPLRDLPQRQRSMRAVFAGSWRLLAADEQAVFRRLAVFQGGFTRQAAEAVAGASLRTLAALLDHSFVKVDAANGRYDLHPLLKQFAAEKLEESGEGETVRDAHCDFYLGHLDPDAAALKGPQQREAYAAMRAEHQNLLAAWHWACATRRTAALASALDSIYRFYIILERYPEGVALFREASEALRQVEGTAANRALLARALRIQAVVCTNTGHLDQGQQLREESLVLARQAGDARTEALVLSNMFSSRSSSASRTVEQPVRQMAAQLEAAGDLWTAAYLNDGLGLGCGNLGRLEEADAYFERALALHEGIGSYRQAIVMRDKLSWIAMLRGDFDAAWEHAEKGISMAQGLGAMAKRYLVSILALCAYFAAFAGNYAAARDLAHEAVVMGRHLGVDLTQSYSSLAMIAWLEGDFPAVEPAAQAVFDEIAAKDLGEYESGYPLSALACIASERGRHDEALALGRESYRLMVKGHPGSVWFPTHALAHSSYQLKQHDEAWGYLQRGFDVLGEGVPSRLHLTLVAAQILAAEGDDERAVRLATRVAEHRGSIHRSKVDATALLAELESAFDAETFAALQAEGRALALDEVPGLLPAGTPPSDD